MPPKGGSSAKKPLRGRTRTSKRITDVSSKCTSVPKGSKPPSSTSTANQDVRPAPSPPSDEKKSALEAENSVPSDCCSRSISNVELQEKPLILDSPNRIDIGDQTQEKKLGDSSNLDSDVGRESANLGSSDGQEVKIPAGDETVVDNKKAEADTDADTVRIVVEGGKRKVFKKVKVIKKVVKRVMKKVPKTCLESSESKGLVHGGNLNGNIQNLETKSNVSVSEQIVKLDPIDIESLEVVKFGTNDIAPLGDELSEVPYSVHTERVQNDVNYDKNSGYSVEQNALLVEKEASKGEQVQNQIEEVKYGTDFTGDQYVVLVEEGASGKEEFVKEFGEGNIAVLEGDSVEDSAVQVEEGPSGEEEFVKEFGEGSSAVLKGDSAEDHAVTAQVEEEASEEEEVEKALIENDAEGLSGDSVGDQRMIEVEDGTGASEEEEVEKAFIENNAEGLSGDSVGDQHMIEVEDGTGASEVQEVVEHNCASISGDGAVSSEIEAEEKRKCQQSDLFLSGLDEDTKVEDIWKVFDDVDKVTRVRLKMNSKTGKNKGFAFVQFASAADAKKALEKYSKVEICGKQCAVQLVWGTDTLFLGNINKKWKDHDVIRLLNEEGIEKIDKVTVKVNPNNLEQNRGFAFVELETSKDAEIAYAKLQKNYVFNQQLKINVAWAQPLVEPDEKELLKVKSIFAEFIPSFWDEKKVKIFFNRFGEIESITLSKNLPSSRRKDFAFVTYSTRDGALACIEAFNHGQVDEDGSKVNVKVSLANPQIRSKQKKHVASSTRKELSRDEPKTTQSILTVRGPGNEETRTRNNHGVFGDRINSTTVELIHLLRQQQASQRPIQAGSSGLDYSYSLSGRKRAFHELDDYVPPSDSRGFLHTRLNSSPLAGNPSYFPHHIGGLPFPHSQQRSSGYTFEPPFHGVPNNLHFLTREQSQFFGHNRFFQRCNDDCDKFDCEDDDGWE